MRALLRSIALFLSVSLVFGFSPAQAASPETLRTQSTDSKTVTSGLEEQLADDPAPSEWIPRVIEAVQAKAEELGETTPAQYHALLLAAVSKEAAGHPSVARALQDPAILRAVADPGQPTITELRALEDQVAKLYRVPPEEQVLLGQALGLDFPQGLFDFFRRDKVARAVKQKFSEPEQQPTLDTVNRFRSAIQQVIGFINYERHSGGQPRSTLDEALIKKVEDAGTASEVRAWLDAATDLVGRFMRLRDQKQVPPVYPAQFEALVDRAVRFRRGGLTFEAALTPEWGSNENVRLIPTDPSNLAEALPDEVAKAVQKFPAQDQASLAGRIEALRRQVGTRPVTWGSNTTYQVVVSYNPPDLIKTVTSLLADSATAAEAQARLVAFGELLRRIDAVPEQVKNLKWSQISVLPLTGRIARLTTAGVPFELVVAPEWGSGETLQVLPKDPAYLAEAVPQGVAQALGKFTVSEQQALLLEVFDLQRQAGPAYAYQVPKRARGSLYSVLKPPSRATIPRLVDLLKPKFEISATGKEATAWIEAVKALFSSLALIDPTHEGSLIDTHWEKPLVSSLADSSTPEQARARILVLTTFLERIPSEVTVTETQPVSSWPRRSATTTQKLQVGQTVWTPQVYETVANPSAVTGMGTARQALERIEIARTLVLRLAERHPTLDWGKVSQQQISELARVAVRLHQEGVDYTVQVMPEKGHHAKEQRTGYSEPDIYGGGSSYTYTYYEDVYVMDSPQTIQLTPAGSATPIAIKSLALDEEFLRLSGVLDVAAGAYSQEGERPYDTEHLRTWFAAQVVGEGAQFDLQRVGLVRRYYPLQALGQDVVVRVYEVGQERTLVPVRTSLLRGEINERLRYQVIPGAEFEALLVPDELQNWAITMPALAQPLQIAGVSLAPVAGVSDDGLRKLANEFSFERLIDAARVYAPEGQAEIKERAQRKERVERFIAAVTQAGLPATPEQFQRGAESLSNRPDLLIGVGEETRALWALHRIAAVLMGSDEPAARRALFNDALRSFDPDEIQAGEHLAGRIAQAKQVADRGVKLGVSSGKLYPALQRTVWLAQVPSEEVTLKQLEERNWIWRSLKTGFKEPTRAEVLARITGIKDRMPVLQETLERQLGIQRPLSVYALGSYVWGKEPNDIDLIVVTEGDRFYEVLEPTQPKGFELPVHVRVVGLNTLNRAVAGQRVENYQRLRIEVMFFYGSAALVAGRDLFAENPMPPDNLPKLIDYYQEKIKGLPAIPGLTEEEQRAKASGWSREMTAMRQLLAERRIAALAETVTRVDEALQPFAGSLANPPLTQQSAIIIPKEVLIDGAALAGIRRIVQERPSTTLVIAGVFTAEEKAVLGGLNLRIQILEIQAPITSKGSALQALEAAKVKPEWNPETPVRILVPTDSPDARPEAIEGAKVLYYLAPMADEVLLLDNLIQAVYQDLFAPNFPVVQVIVARVPITAGLLQTSVAEFRRNWTLAVGA